MIVSLPHAGLFGLSLIADTGTPVMAPFPMAGEAAGLATALLWSLTSIAFAVSSKRWGAMVLNRVRILLAIVLLGMLHLAVHGSFFPGDADLERWLWLGGSGVIGLAIGDSALFCAFNRIGPRKSMILMSTVPILSTLLAWIVLGEALSLLEIVAIVVLVAGVSVVVAERSPGAAASEARGDALVGTLAGLLGALSQALALVIAKQGMAGDYSTISATQIRMVVAGVVIWTVSVFSRDVRQTLRAFGDGRGMRFAVLGAFLGPFLGVWLSLVAVQYAPVGIASSLMALVPIFVIVWVVVFLKERVSLRAIAGTLVATAGVVLLLTS